MHLEILNEATIYTAGRIRSLVSQLAKINKAATGSKDEDIQDVKKSVTTFKDPLKSFSIDLGMTMSTLGRIQFIGHGEKAESTIKHEDLEGALDLIKKTILPKVINSVKNVDDAKKRQKLAKKLQDISRLIRESELRMQRDKDNKAAIQAKKDARQAKKSKK